MTEVYYKVRQVLQSSSGITKCDRLLLQSASGITKCDRLLLQSPSGTAKCDRLLLQSASGITKCDNYYKVRSNNGAGRRTLKLSEWVVFLSRCFASFESFCVSSCSCHLISKFLTVSLMFDSWKKYTPS